MKLPKEGDSITTQDYKHDGSLHHIWRNTMVPKTTDDAVIGVNDHTLIAEGNGRRWVTRRPATPHFHKKYRFSVIAVIRNDGVSYYCNLAGPYVMGEEALKYINCGLDVKVFADGEKGLLDVDEYELHEQEMGYSPDIGFILKENVKAPINWISNGKGPFSQAYVGIWYERYLELKDR